MGDLIDRLEVAENILKTLSFAPMRRTALEKKLFRTKDVSYACFSNMFAFLVVDGDIEKVTAEKTAPFQLTEKGKLFLAWRAKP
jgi:predicted transcriptional regulator